MANKKPVFKPYHQHQLMAFPPTFEELLPSDHKVRIMDKIINVINVEQLLNAYHIKGASNYHPILLLKVLVYGYVTNTTDFWAGTMIAEITKRNAINCDFFIFIGY